MIEHVITDGANVSGYYQQCTCGWESLWNQTRKENASAKERHERDVAEKKLWYAISPEGEAAKPPSTTKRGALWYSGCKSGRRIEPGTYMTTNGWTITLDP